MKDVWFWWFIGIMFVLNAYVEWRRYCLEQRLKNIKKKEENGTRN